MHTHADTKTYTQVCTQAQCKYSTHTQYNMTQIGMHIHTYMHALTHTHTLSLSPTLSQQGRWNEELIQWYCEWSILLLFSATNNSNIASPRHWHHCYSARRSSTRSACDLDTTSSPSSHHPASAQHARSVHCTTPACCCRCFQCHYCSWTELVSRCLTLPSFY